MHINVIKMQNKNKKEIFIAQCKSDEHKKKLYNEMEFMH